MLVNAFSLNGSSMAKINIATPPINGGNGKFMINSQGLIYVTLSDVTETTTTSTYVARKPSSQIQVP
jgi:hypothetical protein